MSVKTILIGARSMSREGLALILGSRGFEIAIAAPSTACALKAAPTNPALAVFDAANNAERAVREIVELHAALPEARIALLAHIALLDFQQITEAFKAGMNAYLINPSAEVFIKSLELIMLGETILPREVLLSLPKHTVPKTKGVGELSAREVEILRHLAAGESNKRIARICVAAEATIKVHVKSILRKLRVINRTQAAMWAAANLPTSNGRHVVGDGEDEIRVEL